ncbi:single-stranded DNA-binding protein [Clostridium gasigenes]|uniref:Single-stranded DNA-binding protein n=1 Tax=Clostridium gasigenes TaxID=94869 RepID=A0A7X0VSA4_9CLOT|nr:single-stranded DNA-binding protein [Clostridium gasigenes]MBB6716252.1 single-stranded DNA-binding protein [Clostridium gasigenes]
MNKVMLIGRLTRDPELNFAANSGTAVCKFGIAVTRQFKKEETDFINCIAFGKTGEIIGQHLTKGKPIAIVGNIRTGNYEAKDGTKRYTTDVVVESFDFIGGNKEKQSENPKSNQNDFGGTNFEEDMTPVDDGDMPF